LNPVGIHLLLIALVGDRGVTKSPVQSLRVPDFNVPFLPRIAPAATKLESSWDSVVADCSCWRWRSNKEFCSTPSGFPTSTFHAYHGLHPGLLSLNPVGIQLLLIALVGNGGVVLFSPFRVPNFNGASYRGLHPRTKLDSRLDSVIYL